MTKPGTLYIIRDPNNPNCVKDSGKRPPITSSKTTNDAWRDDYKAKTTIDITNPRRQGLSRNHRISDNDIKNNIISDINDNFTSYRITRLINLFPWAHNNIDKNKAKTLLANIKNRTNTISSANELYVLMSSHVANISYGNANENSAIQAGLDLNAPKNANQKHSLTPRSRNIIEEYDKDPLPGLLSAPKKAGDRISSSQYALGGAAHKEDSYIDLGNATPRTFSLLYGLFNSTAAPTTTPAAVNVKSSPSLAVSSNG